jgi:hypothetical protein
MFFQLIKMAQLIAMFIILGIILSQHKTLLAKEIAKETSYQKTRQEILINFTSNTQLASNFLEVGRERSNQNSILQYSTLTLNWHNNFSKKDQNSHDIASSKEANQEIKSLDIDWRIKLDSNLIVKEYDSALSTIQDQQRELFWQPNIDENFITIKGEKHKIEIGGTKPASQKIRIGSKSILNYPESNSGLGISGNYLKLLPIPQNINSIGFIIAPELPSSHNASGVNNAEANTNKIIYSRGFNGTEDSDKINYYYQFNDSINFATSYSNNSKQHYFTTSVLNNPNQYITNLATVALSHQGQINNFDYGLSASAERGDIKHRQFLDLEYKDNNLRANKLRALDLGFAVHYFGIGIAGNFGYWGRSAPHKTSTNICNRYEKDHCGNQIFQPTYIALATNYNIGPAMISFSRFTSNLQNNLYLANALSLSYKTRRAEDDILSTNIVSTINNATRIKNINLELIQYKFTEAEASDKATARNLGTLFLIGFTSSL